MHRSSEIDLGDNVIVKRDQTDTPYKVQQHKQVSKAESSAVVESPDGVSYEQIINHLKKIEESDVDNQMPIPAEMLPSRLPEI